MSKHITIARFFVAFNLKGNDYPHKKAEPRYYGMLFERYPFSESSNCIAASISNEIIVKWVSIL